MILPACPRHASFRSFHLCYLPFLHHYSATHLGTNVSLLHVSIHTMCDNAARVDNDLDDPSGSEQLGHLPSYATYMSVLKDCNNSRALVQLHYLCAHIANHVGDLDNALGHRLVTTLTKYGAPDQAYDVFKDLLNRDVVTWTIILTSYLEHGWNHEALNMYRRMRDEGIMPDAITFVRLLKACGSICDLEKGKRLHVDAHSMEYDYNLYVNTTLISMYSKCKSITLAEGVFVEIPQRNIVTWNAMLTAYVEHNQGEKALQLYSQIHNEGVAPNERTVMTALQACGVLVETQDIIEGHLPVKSVSLCIGQALHSAALKKGYVSHVFVANTLVSMYGKCGRVNDAENVFSSLREHDIVSWNAMLSTFVENENGKKALRLYKKMQDENVRPNELTHVMALQACGILADKQETFGLESLSSKKTSWMIGKAIHYDLEENGETSNVFIGSALVKMYGKCGTIVEAENVFLGLAHVDIVSVNAMLSAYVDQGEGEKALNAYMNIQKAHLFMDMTTVLCMLQACRLTGSLDTSWQLYFIFISNGHSMNGLLATTLIHVFGGIASIEDAKAVFDLVVCPNVAIWSANITGYAREGSFMSCLQFLEEMELTGIKPNEVTYLLLLYVCNHAGVVENAADYFQRINMNVGMLPNTKHYACMMDILGRSGNFCRVEDMLNMMPWEGDFSLWMGLLGACRIHGNAELGKHAFDLAVRIHPKEAGAYILMSKIYGDIYKQSSLDDG